MASTIIDAAINSAAGLSNEAKRMLMKVNDGLASATDVSACLLSLDEKHILRALVAHTATRIGISTREVSLPFKAVALAIANV